MGSQSANTMQATTVLLALALGGVLGDGGSHSHPAPSRRGGRQEALGQGYEQPGAAQPEYGGGPPQYGTGDLQDAASGGDALSMLAGSIPGVPGEDYPIYAEVPESGFTCEGQVDGGYYADPEAECQAFHICTADGAGGLAQYSFLCPNGTLFNQNYFICDWWFNFDCATAQDLYSLNDEIAAERESLSGAAASDPGLGGYGAPPEYESSAAGAVEGYEIPEGRRGRSRQGNRG